MFPDQESQNEELDLISFLAQEPLPAQIFQIALDIRMLREYFPELANEKKTKMVGVAIESNSAQTTATSSFGIPLSTSIRNGRLTRWGTRKNNAEEEKQPGWRKLSVIMLSLYLCMVVVSLDRTILGTAIPTITNEFHSLEDVGWYASAYLLTSCATQLIFGKIYKFYNYKWVLMVAIFIFEIGSAICGSAPNSKVFIVGRAIAGLGSAGIFNGVLLIMTDNVPLHRRPVFMGLFGGIIAVANVCGPLLGGVFTTKVNWRWCFYINLPVGGMVAFILFFIVKGSPSKNTDTFRQKLQKMDRFGTLVFIPGIISILLALQWGGNTYNWGNARIIVLFILGGILLTLFVIIQFKAGENATVPIRIIKQRSIASGVWFSFFNPGSMYILIYYLPIWFQAIQGLDAISSGLHTIPLVLALVLSNLLAGIFTKTTGYYVPMVIASSVVATIGAGFFTTLRIDSGPAQWIGWQVLIGWGLGLGMQQANLAVQACLPDGDTSTGLALMFFAQGLGGTIFVTVGQIIFSHQLVKNLSALNLPSLPASLILHTGATELRKLVPAQYLQEVLVAYNAAITTTFLVAIITSAVTIFAGLTMEWKNIKKVKRNPQITSPSASHGGSGSDEECPDLARYTEEVEGVQGGVTDTNAGSSNMLDLQQQLETIREEREKSSSADTSPNATKTAGGAGAGGDMNEIIMQESEKTG
ncbi:putative aflatoxin efflux pump AFLT [Sclerotinia borealis F-4128]|uniref:Putative aflatoxin efflux pump AFLT n=1 Tax=Sclerotinia borealis (strain F-4128) TaxID=1432307 RepID=W9CNL5_SCLBF|nr:putative aflatoxin efflux pump AFLT [Sclerotinia borealis F-4128]